MASFIGNMASGIGKGIMQYGQIMHNAQMEAIRQDSIERRWLADRQDKKAEAEASRTFNAEQRQKGIDANITLENQRNKNANDRLDKQLKAQNERENTRAKTAEQDRKDKKFEQNLHKFDTMLHREQLNLNKRLEKLREAVNDPDSNYTQEQYALDHADLVDKFGKSIRAKLESRPEFAKRSMFSSYFKPVEDEPTPEPAPTPTNPFDVHARGLIKTTDPLNFNFGGSL